MAGLRNGGMAKHLLIKVVLIVERAVQAEADMLEGLKWLITQGSK